MAEENVEGAEAGAKEAPVEEVKKISDAEALKLLVRKDFVRLSQEEMDQLKAYADD